VLRGYLADRAAALRAEADAAIIRRELAEGALTI